MEQEKADGTKKVRPIDNVSWSDAGRDGSKEQKKGSVNGHTAPGERLCHDSLDKLGAAMKYFMLLLGVVPGLLKADIDSAFRRIPIKPAHRWAYGVVFLVAGQVWLPHVFVSAFVGMRPPL